MPFYTVNFFILSTIVGQLIDPFPSMVSLIHGRTLVTLAYTPGVLDTSHWARPHDTTPSSSYQVWRTPSGSTPTRVLMRGPPEIFKVNEGYLGKCFILQKLHPYTVLPIVVRIGRTWSEFGLFMGKEVQKRSELVNKSLIFQQKWHT